MKLIGQYIGTYGEYQLDVPKYTLTEKEKGKNQGLYLPC